MKRKLEEVWGDLKEAIGLKDKEKTKRLLKELRASFSAPLSMSDLARELRVDVRTVARWERGNIPRRSLVASFETLVLGQVEKEVLSVEDLEYLLKNAREFKAPMPLNFALQLLRLRKK